MVGDIVLAIKLAIKQQFCLHEYEEKVIRAIPPHFYMECKKCERVK